MPVTNPNMFIFGKPGRGESATVKALLRRMDFGYRALILGDPKDEYENCAARSTWNRSPSALDSQPESTHWPSALSGMAGTS